MPHKMYMFIKHLSHICKLKPYKETRWLMPNGNPTGLYIYNCVAQEQVPVILDDPHFATWYSCGPTVYDSSHIGHAACYVKLDIIQRILKSFFNINLITAMGITDVDDKIILKAKETGTDLSTITKKYENEFWHDMNSLNVQKPMLVLRVSEHIECIQKFIKHLIDSEIAYTTSDGSVYFDTSQYKDYGKLQKAQASFEPVKEHKKNSTDFALWKGFKPGEPYWETSWGKGRPGWHIECSAMVNKIFGAQIDFHAGGIDLQFPHHENEEAQCCAYHNTKQWTNYWLHIGHLNMKTIKMSKSLQNTIFIQQMLQQYSSDTFRMACLMSNYKNNMEYSEDLMNTAEDTLAKLKYFLRDAHSYVNCNYSSYTGCDQILESLQNAQDSIVRALKADFNTAAALKEILNLTIEVNKRINFSDVALHPLPVLLTSLYVTEILSNFGLQLNDATEDYTKSLIDMLVDFRHMVRSKALSNKDKDLLAACDLIRDNLKGINVQINDKNQVSSWVFTR